MTGRWQIYDSVAARLAWMVCALFIVGAALSTVIDLSVGPTIRYAPLAASVVIFGLPHGAVDYLVPARLGGHSLAVSMGVVSVLYAIVGGVYAVLWLLAPVLAATLFILVTWFHWGQGDVHALVTFVGVDHLHSRSLRAATCVVRGGLPMFVPLLAFPNRYRSVVESWVGLFGTELSVPWLFAEQARLIGGSLFLGFTIVTLLAGYRAAGETRGWRVDAGETGLLWVFFLTLPPLVAIGVYFCIWHALRHVLRVAAIDREALSSARRSLGRFARDAAPLTALALVFLVGFIALVPAVPTTPDELTAAYLVFIAVLTLPHVVVVTWMDGREGIWSP